MSDAIALVCGDPREEKQAVERGDPGDHGASSTCFLFPFAYRPEPDRSPTPGEPCYGPLVCRDAQWVQRRRYFTPETADVLFERAAWFEIAQADWEGWTYPRRFTARLSSGAFEVGLAPPKLVLFEWHQEATDRKRPDAFQTGFLLLEAHFAKDPANRPTLDDLLRFNERFRYWRQPFTGFADRLREVVGRASSDADRDEPTALLQLYLGRWLSLLELPLRSPETGKPLRLFPASWGARARHWWLQELQADPGRAPGEHCLIYADNRAFTWTCALVEHGTAALPQPDPRPTGDPCGPEDFGYWIKLLNVDNPGSSPQANNGTTPFERD